MYTANLTERTVKEMKKRVKAMRALPLIGASSEVRLSKGSGSFNGRRSNGVVNGFLEAGGRTSRGVLLGGAPDGLRKILDATALC
jgi:hypothetical protein